MATGHPDEFAVLTAMMWEQAAPGRAAQEADRLRQGVELAIDRLRAGDQVGARAVLERLLGGRPAVGEAGKRG